MEQEVKRIAVVTGADRGLGLALCAGLAKSGWHVAAGQYMMDWPELGELAVRYPDQIRPVRMNVASSESVMEAAEQVKDWVGKVDVLINNAGVMSKTGKRSIMEKQDYAEMQRQYEVNSLGVLRVVEAFLPLMGSSSFKRFCFVSSEAGSIERSERITEYGYCMSKAALNMAVKILYNHLHPEGYTFRVYHPGWMRSYMSGVKNNDADMEPEEAAVPALKTFLGGLPGGEARFGVEDEESLVMTDWRGEKWPW
ncbi:MAG: SDR family NAD(P)-dependent oxidoreductase [Anaerolineaceae bacterium]|nr:SDR family NAD(P)-dependent oxidoreductase [Anaerolineaceae bacterium]